MIDETLSKFYDRERTLGRYRIYRELITASPNVHELLPLLARKVETQKQETKLYNHFIMKGFSWYEEDEKTGNTPFSK